MTFLGRRLAQPPSQCSRVHADHPRGFRLALALTNQTPRQIQFIRIEPGRAAEALAAPPSGRHAGPCPLANQLALKLREGGEHAEDQSAFWVRGVGRRALACQRFQTDISRLEIVHDADQGGRPQACRP